MYLEVLQGVLIPFSGTMPNSACALFMKKTLNSRRKERWRDLHGTGNSQDEWEEPDYTAVSMAVVLHEFQGK